MVVEIASLGFSICKLHQAITKVTHKRKATRRTIKTCRNKEMECRNMYVIKAFFTITYYLCTSSVWWHQIFFASTCTLKATAFAFLNLIFLSTLTSCSLPFHILHTNWHTQAKHNTGHLNSTSAPQIELCSLCAHVVDWTIAWLVLLQSYNYILSTL